MPKRKLFWLYGITVVVLAGSVAALAVMVKHEPNFFRNSQVPSGEARRDLANTFVRNFGQMVIFKNGRQAVWECEATEAQINSFFEETFLRLGEAESLRKLGISSPTVFLERDQHVRFAFRYGTGLFSSVISYELKIWLVPKEANVIGVQILGVRAGALPISSQAILHQLSEWAKPHYDVMIYRHEGTPVAIIKLQPDQQHQPDSMLTALTFAHDKVSIRGKTLDHALAPAFIGGVPKLVQP